MTAQIETSDNVRFAPAMERESFLALKIGVSGRQVLDILLAALMGAAAFTHFGLFAVAIEWLGGDAWYLRFPWYTVPHALAQSPVWIAAAHWLGVYGLSYVIWFIASAGAFIGGRWWLAFLVLPAVAWLLPPVPSP